MSQEDNTPLEDTFRILVATDIHLGFAEKDPVRDQDSFQAFEEILQLAVANEVDFLLLGGDLFHDSNPSPYCIYKCTDLLKRYCLGDRPVNIEFLSDQSFNFRHLANPSVNYEDPNLNVSLPVFSIHGNHDDPSGQKQISALDVISSTGLINYFGRWCDLDSVTISPICLKKGETKLALYGLSHIKDERLGRLFRTHKVTMTKPKHDDWFGLLVLHQNRVERGPKNFIPATCIPDFIQLVIWGHEHDCRIEPEQEGQVYISQPGSSVATSLAQGESIPKHVGLLEIYKDNFKMHPIRLKTVRPFIFDELLLENPDSENYRMDKPEEQAKEQVIQQINEMIEKAASVHTDPNKPPPLPLIRLIVRYYVERQQFNQIRLGQQFVGHVANPQDCIILKNHKPKKRNKQAGDAFFDENDEAIQNVNEWAQRVEDVVQKHFEDPSKPQMKVLSVAGMTEAVMRYIDKNDNEAISYIMKRQLEKTLKKMIEKDPNVEEVKQTIEDIFNERRAEIKTETDEMREELDDPDRPPVNADEDVHQVDTIFLDDDDDTASTSKPARGKGSRGGRGSRARGKATASTSSSKTNTSVKQEKEREAESVFLSSDEDDDREKNFKPKGGKGSRGNRGSRGSKGRGSRGRGQGNTSYNTLEGFLN